MKDYLNTYERDELITLLKVLDQGENILEDWTPRGNLTKEEHKNLKTSITYARKFYESIIGRQNKTSQHALFRLSNNSSIMLDYKKDLQRLLEKRCHDINKSYEENRDYFKLVELLMHTQCRDCKKQCNDCMIYAEFERNAVPEFGGFEYLENCKYSYETKEEEKEN